MVVERKEYCEWFPRKDKYLTQCGNFYEAKSLIDLFGINFCPFCGGHIVIEKEVSNEKVSENRRCV